MGKISHGTAGISTQINVMPVIQSNMRTVNDAATDEQSVAPAPYVTIALAARVTGLSEKAIRRKIEDGKWIENREFRRSPDGGIFISMQGYKRWVEQATA